jgi:choline monooxygenase
MVNVYPWGASLNVVEPAGPAHTVVRFSSWVWDGTLLGDGAGSNLDAVELEDERVVESVQRGVGARLAGPSMLSPSEERGPRWFHEELARRIGDR